MPTITVNMALKTVKIRLFTINIRFPSWCELGKCMMYPTESIASDYAMFECAIIVPENVNRYLLHKKYRFCAIEYCGDVSFMGGTNRNNYTCYTLKTHNVVPIIAKLWIHHYGGVEHQRVLMCEDITPQSIKDAHDYYYADSSHDVNGKRIPPNITHDGRKLDWYDLRGDKYGPKWTFAYLMNLTQSLDGVRLDINSYVMQKFVDTYRRWTDIRTINEDDSGWWMDDVTAVHDPQFNAFMCPPPFGISFTKINDIDSLHFEEHASALVPSRVHNTRIVELETQVAKFRDYIGYLNDNLNPHLPEQLRVKTIDEIIATD